ncbi:unnamed protein product [Caenorhabditis sp. 36 PRJEB53466]|nr:unnamed protein product [Caenorhabditis sp. 36 PRJEB53466]
MSLSVEDRLKAAVANETKILGELDNLVRQAYEIMKAEGMELSEKWTAKIAKLDETAQAEDSFHSCLSSFDSCAPSSDKESEALATSSVVPVVPVAQLVEESDDYDHLHDPVTDFIVKNGKEADEEEEEDFSDTSSFEIIGNDDDEDDLD